MFEDGFRLEIMRIAGVERLEKKEELNYEVFCHIAVSAGRVQGLPWGTDTFHLTEF